MPCLVLKSRRYIIRINSLSSTWAAQGTRVVLVAIYRLVIFGYALSMAMVSIAMEATFQLTFNVLKADWARLQFALLQSPESLHLKVIAQALEFLEEVHICSRYHNCLIRSVLLLILPVLLDLLNCRDD